MAGGLILLLASAIAMDGSAAFPRSYFTLNVNITQRSPNVDFSFTLTDPNWGEYSNSSLIAKSVNLTATFAPELDVDGRAGGTWYANASNVGESVTFTKTLTLTSATQQELAAHPDTTYYSTVYVNVTYTDSDGNFPRTIRATVPFALNYRPPQGPSFFPAAVGMGLAGAGVVGLGLFVVRRARLHEIYLMHDSGMLIRHWTRETGVVHDSDIMSGMLIVLQDFVRDTWARTSDDELEELTFGDQRVILARGRHTVLAAVVQGRYLNGLPRKLRQAVAEFEDSHETVLADWNGNVDLFPRADDIANRFLKRRSHSAA